MERDFGKYIHCMKEEDVSFPEWPEISTVVLYQNNMMAVKGETLIMKKLARRGKTFVIRRSGSE